MYGVSCGEDAAIAVNLLVYRHLTRGDGKRSELKDRRLVIAGGVKV